MSDRRAWRWKAFSEPKRSVQEGAQTKKAVLIEVFRRVVSASNGKVAACNGSGYAHLVISILPMPELPRLKAQEIPLDDPESSNMFLPTPEKPLVATPAAIEMYRHEVILACFQVLREQADTYQGLDYLQVFEDESNAENLWFIEDGEGGAITALLPSDY